MSELLTLGHLKVEVVRKTIKNVHLTVHPPGGLVRITVPVRMPLETVRLFALSKLPWIRRQQEALKSQERESPREYLDRESHFLWGQRYLLKVSERDAPPSVVVQPNHLLLQIRPGAGDERRQEVLSAWYREQVKDAVTPLMEKWTATLNVRLAKVFVQGMKTRWGSCNPKAGTIRLNTELAKKPRLCLEYVVVHELLHLIEPTHNRHFVVLMNQALPDWEHRRRVLNRLPVRHEEWSY